MGLFGSIFESVINEIRADDAYTRFYSSIPREDFDAITGGEENIDKFIQFFLNCVRDGKSTTTEATNALKLYSRADQLIKNKIKNKVVNGEYEDADDVITDAKYLSSGGAVLSRKKFAKEGYIKLGENEKWLCTCTTNYCANNHYFGDSHWCTASDRMGRYDGYGYFNSYSVNCNCALIQYKWKGVIDDNKFDSSSSLFDKEVGYKGDAISKRYSLFQAQVNNEGYVGQLCDFLDSSYEEDTLLEFVGEELFNIIKDTEKLAFCIKKTQEQSEVEKPYQEAIYESLKKKKERRERELEAKRDRLLAACEEENNRKKELIRAKFMEIEEILSQGDTDILKNMWLRDYTSGGWGLDEETLSATNYCRLTRKIEISDGFYMACIMPCWGNKKIVERIRQDNGYDDFAITDEFRTAIPIDAGMAVVFKINNQEFSVVNLFGPYDEKVYTYTLNNTGSDNSSANRFFEVSTDGYENRFVYDAKTNKTFDIDFDSFVLRLGGDKFIFVDDTTNDTVRDFFVYDGNTQEIVKMDSGTKCYKMYYTSGIGLVNDSWGYQLVYCPSYGLYGVKMNCLEPIEEISTIDGDADKFYVSLLRDRAPVNMFSESEGDFVFGIFGTDTWFEDGCYYLRYRVKNKIIRPGERKSTLMRLVRKQDGNYVKFVDNGDRQEIPCDKYGRTEKDIIGDKNLKAWQDAGGHSPEAKAQMDKMWADRQSKENDGSEAMAAWDDNDVRRDLGIPGTTTARIADQDPRFANQQMKDAMKDPRWKGTIGLKDPEGFLGYMGGYKTPSDQRPNPFYRIGVNGKPLDQPWYDEDEVPAKFAEYSDEINEAVNKIKSLFGRMGLLED